MADEADRLLEQMEAKAEELTAMRSPYAGETAIDTSGLEEVFAAAKHLNDDAHLERTVRAAFAARSLSRLGGGTEATSGTRGRRARRLRRIWIRGRRVWRTPRFRTR